MELDVKALISCSLWDVLLAVIRAVFKEQFEECLVPHDNVKIDGLARPKNKLDLLNPDF